MRTYRFVRWLMARLGVRRNDIGDHVNKADLYLTRWVIYESPRRKVMLHCFHRGDYALALHDHPWRFTSLVLWPGYFENTRWARLWHGPLSLISRPAEHRHAVELLPGRRCWTLVVAGPKVREWGFWCAGGWTHWLDFNRRQDHGLDGCGE